MTSTLLALSILCAAPAPLPKGPVTLPLPLEKWIEGSYAGHPWIVKLEKPPDSSVWRLYQAVYCGRSYEGYYRWDRDTRVLQILERPVGGFPEGGFAEYRIRLDARLQQGGTKVSVKLGR